MPELGEKFGVRALWVFGSTASGLAEAGSDVDLLVDIDSEALSLFGFLRIEHEISDKLGLPVDLVERVSLNRRLSDAVLAQAIPV